MERNQGLWSIERVVCGNGKKDKSRISLDVEKFYGCASRFGGHESFHPINFSSLKLHETIVKLPCFDDENTQTVLHPQQCHLKSSLRNWCLQNPGKIVDISGPGARGEILNARKYQDRRFGRIMMVANHGSCAVAALVNGIEAKLGQKAATFAMEKWKLECPRIPSLKSTSILLHGLQMNLSTAKIDKADMSKYRDDPFEWLGNRNADIWIVRVVQNGMVDHVIAIDGGRQLVMDSACRFPFSLSRELLCQVGGSDVKSLRVAEVRKLVLQPVNTRKRRKNL